MAEPEPVVAVELTEREARAIERALQLRASWYNSRDYATPDDVVEALDAIEPVVNKFEVAHQEAAERIARYDAARAAELRK